MDKTLEEVFLTELKNFGWYMTYTMTPDEGFPSYSIGFQKDDGTTVEFELDVDAGYSMLFSSVEAYERDMAMSVSIPIRELELLVAIYSSVKDLHAAEAFDIILNAERKVFQNESY